MKECANCSYPANYVLVTGIEGTRYCRRCAVNECGELAICIDNTDGVVFSCRKNQDGTIVILIGAVKS